jgi:tripartite-type tricarboxylate transporter receptor subunit TctC
VSGSRSELFWLRTGAKLRHIPYRGDAPALQDLLASRIDIMFMNISSALALHRAGKVHILAVLDAERSPAAPDIPTAREQGVSDFYSVPWYGLMAPSGTPKDVIGKLYETLNAIIRMPDVVERLEALGIEPWSGTPEFATKSIENDKEFWGDVIDKAKVEPQ